MTPSGMNNDDLKETKLAAQFVEAKGDLDEDEFGQRVVDFVANHPELDPDTFVDASVELYVRRRHDDRHN